MLQPLDDITNFSTYDIENSSERNKIETLQEIEIKIKYNDSYLFESDRNLNRFEFDEITKNLYIKLCAGTKHIVECCFPLVAVENSF